MALTLTCRILSLAILEPTRVPANTDLIITYTRTLKVGLVRAVGQTEETESLARGTHQVALFTLLPWRRVGKAIQLSSGIRHFAQRHIDYIWWVAIVITLSLRYAHVWLLLWSGAD